MNIEPADKAKKKLRVALFGDSGNGKTHSAILMAKACGDNVLVIDSEDGASHSFSDLAKFDVLKVEDVTIEGYTKALDLAISKQQPYDAVVIDSLSHAWQNALAQVNTFNNTQLGWGKVTPKWDGLIHKIKRLNCHVFVTMRAKTRQEDNKWVQTYDSRDNTDYEFDVMVEMKGVKSIDGTPTARGVIRKNRFNTGVARLDVGGEVNVGASLSRFLLDWQAKHDDTTPTEPPPQTAEEKK